MLLESIAILATGIALGAFFRAPMLLFATGLLAVGNLVRGWIVGWSTAGLVASTLLLPALLQISYLFGLYLTRRLGSARNRSGH